MRLRLVCHVTVLWLCTIGMHGCRNKQWEPLFNGIDLEGWTVKCIDADRNKSYWTVQDGCISCNSMGDTEHNYVWLCSEREFADFHLKLKFQVYRESTGNSGVQFRSRYDASVEAEYGGWLHGPQADIHGPEPWRTGLIYDETKGIRRWIHPSLPDWRISPEQVPATALETSLFYYEDNPFKWNELVIRCKGMGVKTLVNGNPVTDFNGEGIINDEVHLSWNTGQFGCIALQLHMNDELKIRFKDIYIRELSR